MTHEHLLELVKQVNGSLTLGSWPYVIYQALGKSASVPELKAKLDLRRDQLLGAVILEIEEAMRPFWPRSASRIIVEPEYNEMPATVLSDSAKDAIRACLTKNEALSMRAAKIKGLAGKVLTCDSVLYFLAFCTGLLALGGLILLFSYDAMSDRTAKLAIVIPVSPAVLALIAAATGQVYRHRANNAIIEEAE